MSPKDLNLGARRGWVVSVTARPLYLRERDPVPSVLKAGWARRQVEIDVEKRTFFAPTGVRTLNLPVRRQ